ncbi:MAG: HEAT repeat domain-containing protein [Myxococcota bacterium]
MSGDFNEKVARARAAGQTPQAVALWRELITVVNVEEQDYRRCCSQLAELYLASFSNRPLAAAAIKEYLRDLPGAEQLYRQAGSPRDQARLAGLQGNHLAASQAYRSAGMPAHAAHSAEQAKAHEVARGLWQQLIRPLELQGDNYAAALARFNAGRNAHLLGDKSASDALYFEAINALGKEADDREQAKDRDGAFRCFMVMAAIGRQAGAFEDMAEGFLNCTRLLKQKGDRFGTIQMMHDLIRAAEECGELHAAAELYREAGEYARRMGFLYADYFLCAAGKAWKRVAMEGMRAKRQTALVENALAAAVDAFSRTLDTAEVARCYQALAALDLPTQKKERYQKLAEDLAAAAAPAGSDDNGPPALPEYFRRKPYQVEHWVKDLLDREAGADLNLAASRLLAENGVWDLERRRALNLFLAYDDHVRAHGPDAPLTVDMLNMLSESRHPSLVGPLLEAYRRGNLEQRAAAVMAAGKMRRKEGFALVDAALATDHNGELYRTALAALRGMVFTEALDSVTRIFSNHDDGEVKRAALRIVAMIGTNEAAEFLLDVVRANSAGLGTHARELLLNHANDKMLSALENNKKQEPDGQHRGFITSVISKVRNNRRTEAPIT